MTPRIRTSYDPKPIHDYRWDWTATLHSYEPGDPIGWSRTEAEAIADLGDQLEDAA